MSKLNMNSANPKVLMSTPTLQTRRAPSGRRTALLNALVPYALCLMPYACKDDARLLAAGQLANGDCVRVPLESVAPKLRAAALHLLKQGRLMLRHTQTEG